MAKPHRLRLPLLISAVVLATATAAGPGAAEFPPTKLHNLKVFPADIPTQDLLDAMKGFSQALGVRCWHCHQGEEGKDLSTFDFVSDDKPAKRIARLMLQMTRGLNREQLAGVAPLLAEANPDHAETPRVSCLSCHRGKTHVEH